jgi:hypothetical protein
MVGAKKAKEYRVTLDQQGVMAKGIIAVNPGNNSPPLPKNMIKTSHI